MKKHGHFRKIPVVIEAVQINKGMFIYIPEWLIQAVADKKVFIYNAMKGDEGKTAVDVVTLEGTMRGSEGDWVIKGVHGELYLCKKKIFESTFEPTNEETVSDDERSGC